MATYFDVLKKAYYDDEFWRKLIANPAHTLDKYGISLNVDDEEKLFAALKNFSLVFAFDKYRDLRKIRTIPKNPPDPPAFDNTGWGCDQTRVPWGQT